MSIRNIQNDNLKGWLDGNFNELDARDVTIDGLSHKNLAENVLSAGYISGCEITDNLDGTISLATGTAYLREVDNDFSDFVEATIPNSAGMVMTNLQTNYVYIDYNAGTPVFATSLTASDVNQNTTVSLYEIYRSGTDLFIRIIYQYQNNDNKRIQDFLVARYGNTRTDGLYLDETGLRKITVSIGTIWTKLNQIITTAIDTSGSDTFTQYYLTGSTTWVQVTGATDWDSVNYNDTSGGLVPMIALYYSFQEFYMLTDGSLHSMYGQDQYVAPIDAEEADRIHMWPGLESQSVYIGRLVYQKSAVTAFAIMNPYEADLSQSSATGDHTHLSNLSVDDHLQYVTLANRGGETLNIDTIEVDTIDGEAGTAVTISGIVNDTNVLTATSLIGTELSGGITAGLNLDLNSTTHPTKGLINIDSSLNILGAAEPAYTQGNVFWDSGVETLAVQVDPAVTLQVGQELYIKCKNTTGSPINKGQAVYISGATGPVAVLITEAQADAVGTACVIGVTAQQIIHNAFGLITVQGLVEDLNTNTFNSGDTLYLSATVPGGLQNTAPVSPNFAVRVAKCIVKSVGSGTILVTSPIEITELASMYDLRVINSTELVHLTASRLVATDASKMLESSDIDAWINGTTNQVIVTPSVGTVTLSAPQDLHSLAVPTFNGIQATNTQLIDMSSANDIEVTGNGTGRFIVRGNATEGRAFCQLDRDTVSDSAHLTYSTTNVDKFSWYSMNGLEELRLFNYSLSLDVWETDAAGTIFQPYTYANVATGRIVYINADGEMGTLSSLQIHKKNIQDIGDCSWIYQLEPKTFNRRKKTRQETEEEKLATGPNGVESLKMVKSFTAIYGEEVEDKLETGFIAEQIASVHKDACYWDDESAQTGLAGVDSRAIIAGLVAIVKEQNARISALEV